MEYLLLATWFLSEHAISSYQVGFASRQACEMALSQLKDDAVRLGAPPDTSRTPPGTPPPEPKDPDGPLAPVLSAICVSQR